MDASAGETKEMESGIASAVSSGVSLGLGQLAHACDRGTNDRAADDGPQRSDSFVCSADHAADRGLLRTDCHFIVETCSPFYKHV